jgi:hypothetical protein
MKAITVASEPGVKLSSRAYVSLKWSWRAPAPPIATSIVAIRNGRNTSTPAVSEVHPRPRTALSMPALQANPPQITRINLPK